MIVMKFGGTSNEDASAMRNVLGLVQAHLEHKPVVVISAIAKGTNALEEAARVAAAGQEAAAVTIATQLFERHYTIVDELLSSRELASELEKTFFQYLHEIKILLKGISILRELTPRSMDAICSYGERLSSKIIAAGLQEMGVNTVWVDVKDFMITDDTFGRARPLSPVVAERLDRLVRPLLEENKVVVTQGFIGVTQAGAYTTMGRESSDYSASIIGAAMNAERVQIWTDVDGILTADPRLVEMTSKIERMSFEEAFELSYFGAKVLHPNTMLPMLEKNIPVQILNSKNAQSGGTWVDAQEAAPASKGRVKSMAFKKGISIVAVTPHTRFSQYHFWEGMFNVLNRHDISIGIMVTSEYSLACSIETKFLTAGLISGLEELGVVQVFEEKASLCFVGSGLRGQGGIGERIFRALHSLNVYMVSYGASELSLTLVIDEDSVSEALNSLHTELFEGNT